MSFFEFPHTRTYDTDLGWIIKHLGELLQDTAALQAWAGEHKIEYKQLKKEIDNLLDKYTDPITEWDATKEYTAYSLVSYEDKTYVAIQNVPVGVGIGDTRYWIESAGIQTQIGAMQEALNSLSGTFEIVKGNTILPSYMGDWIEDASSLPSCCYKMGNTIYTISSFDDTTNNGILRIFNLDSNTAGSTKTIKCGHANSITYCPETDKFYIAPVWDRSTGERVSVTYLYVYDRSFTGYTEMALPAQAMSVTYDPIKGIFYFMDYYNNVYAYDFDTLSWTIKYNIVRPSEYNQDFAVYNDNWFLTHPDGAMICGIFGKDEINHRMIGKTDNDLYWKFGELEGMEFTEDGHLLAVIYTNITSSRNGFIVDIPLGFTAPYVRRHHFSRVNYTLTLSEETIAKFTLQASEIRSLNQLTVLIDESSLVDIKGTVTEIGDTRLNKNVRLNFTQNCNYITNKIAIDNGNILIAGPGQITINSSGDTITIFRTGSIKFAISSVNISLPNKSTGDLIQIGLSLAQTIIRNMPISVEGYTFTIAGVIELESFSNYYGTTKNITHIERGTITTTIPTGSDVSDEYEVTYKAPYPRTPTVMLTCFTSTNNMYNVGVPIVTAETTTGFKFKVWRNVPGSGGNAGPSIRWFVMQ